MAEVIYSTPGQTIEFLRGAGFKYEPERIIEVFPGYFSERRVLRITNSGSEQSRVVKVRPYDASAKREVQYLQPLLASYRFSGTHFGGLRTEQPWGSKYVAINMPYLGVDITVIAQEFNAIRLGYETSENFSFTGFTKEEIRHLIKQLRSSQMQFSQHHGLIHGDLFQMNHANNIVYNQQTERLLLVDAEALTETDDNHIDRFNIQAGQVEEWMNEWLLK